MKAKPAKNSLAVYTNLVLPNETNVYDNLFGGELLAKIDRLASISARKHAERETVTASVNHVSFIKPIPKGGIVRLESKVSRAFNTSMEVYVDVWIDYASGAESEKSNEGIYTFVAVDKYNKPMGVPELIPETKIEKQRFEEAIRRKELSLIITNRMKPEDAKELKKLFT